MLLMVYMMLRLNVWIGVMYLFFFKQKTAYEMRISDWSSDVCSSDLQGGPCARQHAFARRSSGRPRARNADGSDGRQDRDQLQGRFARQIGRASCRERVCQYV